MQKYQLQESIQKYNKQEHHKNTSYREQFDIYQLQGTMQSISRREQYKAATCWEQYKIHQLHETVPVILGAENNIK